MALNTRKRKTKGLRNGLVAAALLVGGLVYFNSGEEEVVTIRVADVGAGLGTVSLLPDGKVLVYDAGRYERLMPTLRELVPDGKIDFLVLSHNDSDHIGAVGQIEKEFSVGTVYYSEFRDLKYGKSHADYTKCMEALKRMEKKGTRLVAVSNKNPAAGSTIYKHGDIKITYLCGFSDPLAIWDFRSGDRPSKPNNAISLMIRLDYKNSSVIYGGDAVGTLDGDACVYTEKFLLTTLKKELLDADVIISPHHGADNGDCNAFIEVVSPEYVIFSAGSEHGHPRASTASRYLNHGVNAEKMLRTDRGDHEKKYGAKEWSYGRVQGCEDLPGDDDIEIILTGDEVKATYLYPDKCLCKGSH